MKSTEVKTTTAATVRNGDKMTVIDREYKSPELKKLIGKELTVVGIYSETRTKNGKAKTTERIYAKDPDGKFWKITPNCLAPYVKPEEAVTTVEETLKELKKEPKADLRFKVDDIVMVKKDLKPGKRYNDLTFAYAMERSRGCKCRVTKALFSGYELEAENGEHAPYIDGWFFNDAMLEPAAKTKVEFKKGDVVRVKADLVAGQIYGTDRFLKDMIPTRGKEYTIKAINDYGYRLKTLNNTPDKAVDAWNFTDDMLELVTAKFATGNYVRVKPDLKVNKENKYGRILSEDMADSLGRVYRVYEVETYPGNEPSYRLETLDTKKIIIGHYDDEMLMSPDDCSVFDPDTKVICNYLASNKYGVTKAGSTGTVLRREDCGRLKELYIKFDFVPTMDITDLVITNYYIQPLMLDVVVNNVETVKSTEPELTDDDVPVETPESPKINSITIIPGHCKDSTELVRTTPGRPAARTSAQCTENDEYNFEIGAAIALMRHIGLKKTVQAMKEYVDSLKPEDMR